MSQACNWAWCSVALGVIATDTTIDFGAGNVISLTLSANVTLSATGIKPGQPYTLIITQDGTGGRVVTWGAGFSFQGGLAPSIDTGAGTTWYHEFQGTTYATVVYRGMPSTNYVTSGGAVLSSPFDSDIYLQPGYANATPTNQVRRGVLWQMGKLNSATGKGGFIVAQHPDVGTMFDWQVFGTPGTPDTNLYSRFAFPKQRRTQFTGGAAEFDQWESTAGAVRYNDLNHASALWQWRNGATGLFAVAPTGVAVGNVTPVAGQDRSLQFEGLAADPTGNATAGNALMWVTSNGMLRYRLAAQDYYVQCGRTITNDFGASSGAKTIVLDQGRTFSEIVATGGGVTLTITGGRYGLKFTLKFTQDVTGGRALTLGAGLTNPTGVTLVDAAANQVSYVHFMCTGATTAEVISVLT